MTPEQQKLNELVKRAIEARKADSMISSGFINSWCELQEFFESNENTFQSPQKSVVSADEIIDCLLTEYKYWKEVDADYSIGAIGAIANVIAFATVKNHRADWHPEKNKS